MLNWDVFFFENIVDPDQMTSKIRIHMLFYPICESIVIKGILHEAWLEIKKWCTVKPVLSGHSRIDKTKILMTNGSLMKGKSIAECSTCINQNRSFVFFLSGRLRQILLYVLLSFFSRIRLKNKIERDFP